jgi:hypothetical protein
MTDFAAADAAYFAERVIATAKCRKSHWEHWHAYIKPLGLDPYLQNTPFDHRIRAITGFASQIRRAYYNNKCQVRVGTISSAITAIGKTIALAYEHNPTKVLGSDKFHDRIQEVLNGWKQHNPHSTKKLPVEADIPELIATLSTHKDATELCKAVGDMSLIAFYYLLRTGEFTTKDKHPKSKRTDEFKMEDVTFF